MISFPILLQNQNTHKLLIQILKAKKIVLTQSIKDHYAGTLQKKDTVPMEVSASLLMV